MKNSREIETELAYSWTGNPQTVRSLESLNGWKASSEDYQLIDSLYDTNDELLSGRSTAVRIRSKGTETTMTIKRYVGEGNSGESKFEEISKKLESHQHPEKIERKALNLQLSSSTPAILKQLQFINNRQEILLSHENQKVLLVNEEVTYANKTRTYTEHILEVELINISEGLIRKIRDELESKYPIKIFKEGKSDRAKRFLKLENEKPLIENVKHVKPIKISAHGGKGLMDMYFFHQPYNNYFSELVNKKVIGFEGSNWNCFVYAHLPIGADIKSHYHNETDEIYFVIKGSATITIDGRESPIGKGDCILTRKGSVHSVQEVTKPLEFIAIEIK